jgi:hypothetical protein
LRDLAYELRTRFHKGYVTPKELRDLAGMADTQAEKVLISNLLRKWLSVGIVERVKKGLYRFVPREFQLGGLAKILEALKGSKDAEGPDAD